MNLRFQDFPRSYYWSQKGIGFALVTLAVGGMVLRICPAVLRAIVLSCLGLLVFCCLLLSHYVVIRYPYISLVEPEDGDSFSRHFASAGSSLYVFLKVAGLLVPFLIATAIWVTGFQDIASTLTFAYCIPLIVFMSYFIVAYDSVQHPTITTFVRSTLGLGVPLYPFYIVTIVIGVVRCRHLLKSQA